jgi:hypothetical protein
MEISVTDTAGTLFTHTTFDSLGDLQFNPAGGSDITLFAAGGIRANRNQNSGATADFIYSSATYANHFRIDVSADQTNIGNATQGSLVSFDGSTLVATFNRSNAGANIVVESSSAGVDLWETDTTNDLIANYGGVVVPPTRVTTTYTILRSDHEVFCNTDSAGFTVTLPAGVNGQRYRIVNTGSSGNTLTIAPNGAETIGGAAASVTLADGETLILTYQTTDGWY